MPTNEEITRVLAVARGWEEVFSRMICGGKRVFVGWKSKPYKVPGYGSSIISQSDFSPPTNLTHAAMAFRALPEELQDKVDTRIEALTDKESPVSVICAEDGAYQLSLAIYGVLEGEG